MAASTRAASPVPRGANSPGSKPCLSESARARCNSSAWAGVRAIGAGGEIIAGRANATGGAVAPGVAPPSVDWAIAGDNAPAIMAAATQAVATLRVRYDIEPVRPLIPILVSLAEQMADRATLSPQTRKEVTVLHARPYSRPHAEILLGHSRVSTPDPSYGRHVRTRQNAPVQDGLPARPQPPLPRLRPRSPVSRLSQDHPDLRGLRPRPVRLQ